MTTHHIHLTLTCDRRMALTLALAVALPILAVTGLLTALAAHPPAAPAAPALSSPTTLSYQGQVSVGGQPFSGQGQFKFAIVSSNGASAFWTNDGTNLGAAPFQPSTSVQLTVTSGLFSVLLGDTSLTHMTVPLSSAMFVQPNRALRVWFNDGSHGFQQLAPDVLLAAVPYALNAETLDGLDSAAFLTQAGADARYARNHPTLQQIALLKWYTAVSTTHSNFTVGASPSGVAFDGENIWVVNNFSRTVSVLRASDGAHVLTPTVGANPQSIAYDGANMWVTNADDHNVSVLRASDGAHVMTPLAGNKPRGIAFDGTNMWVVDNFGNSVNVLRASDGVHVMTVTVGNTPGNIAFDGTNMWVTNIFGGDVSVVRASDGFHVMTPTVGANPFGVAFDGVNMWVVNNSDSTVSVLRASDGSHVVTPTVGTFPQNIAFDGANMWVTNSFGGSATVLRASDGALVRTVPVGTGPDGLAFDGAFMWIANGLSGTVSKR